MSSLFIRKKGIATILENICNGNNRILMFVFVYTAIFKSTALCVAFRTDFPF